MHDTRFVQTAYEQVVNVLSKRKQLRNPDKVDVMDDSDKVRFLGFMNVLQYTLVASAEHDWRTAIWIQQMGFDQDLYGIDEMDEMY